MSTAQQAPGTIPDWTLGWRLQRSLTHAGVSAQSMADELGMTRGTVSRWMNDHGAPPRPAYVKLWALRTGVPVEWLMTGEVSHPNGPTDVPPAGFEPATHGLQLRKLPVARLDEIRARQDHRQRRLTGRRRSTIDIVSTIVGVA